MHYWVAEVEPMLALTTGTFYLCDHSGQFGDDCVPPSKPVRVKEMPFWPGLPPGELDQDYCSWAYHYPEPETEVCLEEAKLAMCPGICV